MTTVTTITPPCRPAPKECESLSQHEFGLNGMDDVGRLHSQEHVSVSEIRQRLQFRRLPIGERYDNLAAQQRNNPTQIRAAAQAAGVKLPALDVLQPTAGAEVLQIVHDRLLGAFLLKRNLQYAAADCGQGALARQSPGHLGWSAVGAQCNCTAAAGWFAQHCQVHFLKAAVTLVYEADRHAKKGLAPRMHGVRPIDRAVVEQDNPVASRADEDAVASGRNLNCAQRQRNIFARCDWVALAGASQPDLARHTSDGAQRDRVRC